MEKLWCLSQTDMAMKKILPLFVAVVMSVAAGCSDDDRRDPGGHNGREEHPELPAGVKLTDEDRKELQDATPRFVGKGVALCYGVPGVLIVEDDRTSDVSIRELADDGHSARFSRKSRRMELDGTAVGVDAVKIGEADGMQWWRAASDDGSAVYFVVSIN